MKKEKESTILSTKINLLPHKKKENERKKMNEEKKYNILETVIRTSDRIFVFFISLNILLIITGLFPVVDLTASLYPNPDLLNKISRFTNILRVGGIMTLSITIPIFLIIRFPLAYKLKTLKFTLIKKKYGGTEDLFKFYREFYSGNFYDRRYKKLGLTHMPLR